MEQTPGFSQPAYRDLTQAQKDAVDVRLELRKQIYLRVMKCQPPEAGADVLIVGDRPGPSAPTTRGYHHTPFYSTKHCSGWLNALLEANKIDESRLAWINAYQHNGKATPRKVVDQLDPNYVITLGGNALKWYRATMEDLGCNRLYQAISHPQYHKRFHNKQTYALIPLLKWVTL